MPRSASVAIENNFSRGLITEATGLNFPENACTETFDCEFDVTGAVSRRLGFDFEFGSDEKTINRAGDAISTYLWKNVAGDGNVTLYVAQVGDVLFFWDVTQSQTLSSGKLTSTVSLTTFSPAGAPNPQTAECQFSDGNGFLFVTHPNVDPFFVAYNVSTKAFTATKIDIEMRDFAGVTDELVKITDRPSALSTAHKYNIQNQGWGSSKYAPQSSTSSVTPALGPLTFTVTTGGPWVAGDPIFIWFRDSRRRPDTSEDQNSVFTYLMGTVTSYSGASLVINCTSFNGNNTARTDWLIASERDHIQIFQQAISFFPSNVDVWWLFKDANDEFDPRKTLPYVDRGTTPAPKGKYVLKAFNQDRSTVSGVPGLGTISTGFARPTTCAFHAGRVFFAGVPFAGYSGNIYFTQIIEPGRTDQFGRCYQESDPTSETLFDLLPSDGGVIIIPEAGTIYKLWSIQGGLLVFASNGVWHISGSTGIGFTATDFTIRRLSTIKCISGTSFVDIGGYPAWWSGESIYVLQAAEGGLKIESLTDSTIFDFYAEIPFACKKQARGFFNLVTRKAQWLFRSTVAGTIEEIYEYDRILNFNTRTGALYPWTISNSSVKIHSLVVPESVGGSLVKNEVIDNAVNNIVTESGDNVVAYLTEGNTVAVPGFRYFSSFASGGSSQFSFVEERDTSYFDFVSHDLIGKDYTSYFITGFKIHGQAQKKFQSNWLYVYVDQIPSQYNLQAIWNFANTGNSGDFSTQAHQRVVNTNIQYDVRFNRLKIRGEGVALQFKVFSEPGEPFSIIGWSGWETISQNV